MESVNQSISFVALWPDMESLLYLLHRVHVLLLHQLTAWYVRGLLQ